MQEAPSFPQALRQFTQTKAKLGALVKCKLCNEFLKDPQFLGCNCGESFCCSCLDEYWHSHESKCPRCKLPVFRSDIRSNRMFANFTELYHALSDVTARFDHPLLQGLASAPDDDATQVFNDESVEAAPTEHSAVCDACGKVVSADDAGAAAADMTVCCQCGTQSHRAVRQFTETPLTAPLPLDEIEQPMSPLFGDMGDSSPDPSFSEKSEQQEASAAGDLTGSGSPAEAARQQDATAERAPGAGAPNVPTRIHQVVDSDEDVQETMIAAASSKFEQSGIQDLNQGPSPPKVIERPSLSPLLPPRVCCAKQASAQQKSPEHMEDTAQDQQDSDVEGTCVRNPDEDLMVPETAWQQTALQSEMAHIQPSALSLEKMIPETAPSDDFDVQQPTQNERAPSEPETAPSADLDAQQSKQNEQTPPEDCIKSSTHQIVSPKRKRQHKSSCTQQSAVPSQGVNPAVGVVGWGVTEEAAPDSGSCLTQCPMCGESFLPQAINFHIAEQHPEDQGSQQEKHSKRWSKKKKKPTSFSKTKQGEGLFRTPQEGKTKRGQLGLSQQANVDAAGSRGKRVFHQTRTGPKRQRADTKTISARNLEGMAHSPLISPTRLAQEPLEALQQQFESPEGKAGSPICGRKRSQISNPPDRKLERSFSANVTVWDSPSPGADVLVPDPGSDPRPAKKRWSAIKHDAAADMDETTLGDFEGEFHEDGEATAGADLVEGEEMQSLRKSSALQWLSQGERGELESQRPRSMENTKWSDDQATDKLLVASGGVPTVPECSWMASGHEAEAANEPETVPDKPFDEYTVGEASALIMQAAECYVAAAAMHDVIYIKGHRDEHGWPGTSVRPNEVTGQFECTLTRRSMPDKYQPVAPLQVQASFDMVMTPEFVDQLKEDLKKIEDSNQIEDLNHIEQDSQRQVDKSHKCTEQAERDKQVSHSRRRQHAEEHDTHLEQEQAREDLITQDKSGGTRKVRLEDL